MQAIDDPPTKLSGGEAQRVKLAREPGKIKHGAHNLYILDEPTTGMLAGLRFFTTEIAEVAERRWRGSAAFCVGVEFLDLVYLFGYNDFRLFFPFLKLA